MKKKLSTIILCAVFLVGLALVLYPSVSDWWNSFHQSRAIANYAEVTAGLSEEEYQHYLQQANDYNRALLEKTNPLVPSDEELEEYNSVLNISGDGIMGYIEIPKIKCSLPIHHGVGESVLQVAIGHIPGTSLPVGGPSTHCVVSGHRGLPSAKLFTDLDQLAAGDTFMLQTLDNTLTYEVDQIRIVEPQEVNDLTIIPGGDYVTLITCTPYGINSHRLLVRGHRIENQAAASSVRVTSEAIQVEPILVAPVAAAPMLAVLMTMFFTGGGRNKPKPKPSKGKRQQ